MDPKSQKRIKIKSKENTSFNNNKNIFPDMGCRKILINMIKFFRWRWHSVTIFLNIKRYTIR